MTEEVDLYRSAELLIDSHGVRDAEIYAAQRVDESLTAGDLEGRAVWLGIVRAIRTLSDSSQASQFTLH